MKITHIIQHLGLGGAESFVVELANQQQDDGHDVDVLMVGKTCHLRDELRVPYTVVERRGGPDLKAIQQVRHHLRVQQTEVVHAHTAPGLLYGGLGATWARTPATIFTEHSSSSPDNQYGRKTRLLNVLASKFDAIVTFDDELARRLKGKPELRRARIEVIPNGVSISDPRTLNRDESRAILNVPKDSLLVLAVGGLRPQKNYELMIDVARLTQAVHFDGVLRDVQFVIIGEGGDRSLLESHISSVGASNVRLFGGYENARCLFQGADLLLNTSTWEGMPITMLEAMAECLAVVATRTGSVETVLGAKGIFVSFDPAAIASTLTSLLEDPNARAAVARAGKERVAEKFSIQRVAREYEELYRSTLPGTSAPDHAQG